MTIPKTPKGISSRITKIRSQLSAFKKEYGGHDDSGGTRYYLFYLYFLLGDNRRSSEYLRWFQKEFPDDSGEPFALLCWSLILYRMGKDGDFVLARTMLSNIYLIPHILGGKMGKVDMWHSSSDEDPEYIDYFPEQIQNAITKDDKIWIKGLYFSDRFQDILNRHIEINHELQTASICEKRSELVQELYNLLDGWR